MADPRAIVIVPTGSLFAQLVRSCLIAERNSVGAISLSMRGLPANKRIDNDILDSPEEVDSMLQTFVVKHEVKKLNARKRTSKSTSSRSKRSRREDDGSDSGY